MPEVDRDERIRQPLGGGIEASTQPAHAEDESTFDRGSCGNPIVTRTHRRAVHGNIAHGSVTSVALTAAPSISAHIIVQAGCRRRSVGDPGFSSRMPAGDTVSHGMWE